MGIERFFTTPFVVQRPSITNTGGEAVRGFSPVGSFAGHLEQLSAAERVRDQRTEAESTHRLYCSLTTDIKAGDQVVANSITYEVIGEPNKLRLSRNHHIEAGLRRAD